MGVSKDIDSLINDIGKAGMNESTVKGRLASIKDQAEAQEAELEKKDAIITRQEKEITAFHLKEHKQEQAPKERYLKEDTERVLKSLVERENHGHVAFSVQDVIAELQLQRTKGLHHFDVLSEEKMIDWVNPGVKCILRPLGRSYAYKHLS
jgi:hypothetical protein